MLDLMRDIILATDLAHHLRIFKDLQKMAEGAHRYSWGWMGGPGVGISLGSISRGSDLSPPGVNPYLVVLPLQADPTLAPWLLSGVPSSQAHFGVGPGSLDQRGQGDLTHP
jgi:hypothetical protein